MIAFIVFILVISLLVFVHELGHFVSARQLGVGVEEFGFGFPPRIIGITREHTIYSINWIPFGGFVKLKGETPDAPRDPDSFTVQPRTRRFVILASGVLMNYLLSIVLFCIGFSIGLPTAVDPGTTPSDVKNVHAEIASLETNGPALRAGIQAGDVVHAINGTTIESTEVIRSILKQNADKQLTITVERQGTSTTVDVTPVKNADGEYKIGIGILDVGTISYPFPRSLLEGFSATISVTGQVFNSFGQLLKDLVIERKVSGDLSGPVGVIVLTGQAFHLGIPYLIQFVALLSITLAVVNFFPLPALDGGRALFVVIEAVRRKAIDHRIEAFIHTIGFYALIALVLLVSIHDVQKYNIRSSLVGSIRSLFGR